MVTLVKKHLGYLVILFAVALGVRAAVYAGYLSQRGNYWQVDSLTYHLVAQGVAGGKGISQPNGTPNFYRLPGYPLFMGACYKLFGVKPEAALWVQVVLASLIPALIFLLGLALFPQQVLVAKLAAAYSAVHIGLVLYSGFFMTESLFLLLLLWCLICFFRREENPKLLAISGFMLGLASLVRPVGHYAVVIMLLILLATARDWHQRLRNTIIFLVSWLGPVAIWLARNYLLMGHLFFHTLPGGHFLYLSAARVAMAAQECTYVQARLQLGSEINQQVRTREQVEHRKLSEIERCIEYEKLARSYFLKNPLITLRVWATDIFRTTFSLFTAELLYLSSGRKQIAYFDTSHTLTTMIKRYLCPETDNAALRYLVWLEILLSALVLMGVALGLYRVFGTTAALADRQAWLSGMSIGALFITLALAGGYARMRLPVEPFIMLFSAYGYVTMFARTTVKKKRVSRKKV